jgi:hypothetical protein
MMSAPAPPPLPQAPAAPPPPPAFGTVQSPQKKQNQGGFSSTILGTGAAPAQQNLGFTTLLGAAAQAQGKTLG